MSFFTSDRTIFIDYSIAPINTKTAHQTHQLINRALREQADSPVYDASSSGPTFLQHHTHHKVTSSHQQSNDHDHLPQIASPTNAVFRHYGPNGNPATYGFHVNNDKFKPPSKSKKKKEYIPKTMNTTTTIKMPKNGEPVTLTRASPPPPPPPSKKKTYHENHRKPRQLWWTPKRNHIEIRSEDTSFHYNASSKVGSFDNIDYHPTGGHISIRDEPMHWRAAPKVDSLSNANWTSTAPRIAVRSEKLEWDARPKVNSMMNLDYKPTGGNVAIRDDRLDLSHVTPRVDCGFIE
ncbi:unnamed protein product [Adineta steineri]|uniref:Uncharacterized protein n=2 Tax=Adineta steineri TaxID=433720 RepID=A0A814ZQS7_9BILA|nr:unnamed protein product [Adineta steineri]CAF1531753.1 unnamed protein product [Adineta steineri]